MVSSQPHLFLDCDGVLADFDSGARAILGMSPAAFQERHGHREFWKRLARARNFYGELPQMEDAQRLFEAVEHLKPTILTGLPLGTWAARQKEEWAGRHFPGVPIITTLARKKHLHMERGDVLVDDRDTHRHPVGERRRDFRPSQEFGGHDPPTCGNLPVCEDRGLSGRPKVHLLDPLRPESRFAA